MGGKDFSSLLQQLQVAIYGNFDLSEIEYLIKELRDTTIDWTPSRSMTWRLVVQLEELVPSSLFKPRMKGRIKKAARLLFVRHVTGRKIISFRQLKPGEVVRIKRWLEGNGPSPNDDKLEEDKEVSETVRVAELTEFWLENKQRIWNLANWLKVTKRR